MAASYQVAVGSFEGPFDLLLHLIARHKLDIHEISLAQITDDYLAVLRQLDHLDLEVTTEFLVVAATLLELKAARLLPGEEDPELEELALEARDLLYARLLDYRTFKEAAAWLADRFVVFAGYQPRQVALEDRYAKVVPDADLKITVAELAGLAARAFEERPTPVVDTSHIQPVRMTVREAAQLVVDELGRAGGSATFREITAGCRHRIEVIMVFLALLELYKLDQLELEQAAHFGELRATWNEAATWTGSSLEGMEVYQGEEARSGD